MLPSVSRFGFMPKSSGLSDSRRMGGFVLDMSEVTRNMDYLNNVLLPQRIKSGLGIAGKALMRDSVATVPTVPIKRPGYSALSMRQAGELRASGAVFVDKNKIADSRTYGETATGIYQPNTYGGLPIDRDGHQACVVFNAPYAAKQHEAFPRKSEPTAGKFYLSSKLYANGVQYIGMVARVIEL